MEQKLKSALTKKKILDAAELEFAEKGFSAARVDEIAKKAGINKQMIYMHFKSKENLCATVLENVYARLAAYEKVLSEREFEGLETIRCAILEYFDFLMENPTFVRLVLWENLDYARHSEGVETSLFYGVKKILETGIEKGVIRKELDIEQTAISVNMFCFSAFSNIHTVSKFIKKDLSGEAQLKKRAEHIADILMRFVAAD